jgi:hypothetical protein
VTLGRLPLAHEAWFTHGGLVPISGALPQLCVLLAAIPFTTALWFFGADELVGHLQVYAVPPHAARVRLRRSPA